MNNEHSFRQFVIDKEAIMVSKFLVWFFVSLSLLALIIIFIPEKDEVVFYRQVQVALILFAVGISVAVYFKSILNKMPFYNISIDQDGIWYSHLEKNENLVRWTEIRDVDERKYQKKVRLLDFKKQPLIDLHFQIKEFKDLILVIHQNIKLEEKILKLPLVIKKDSILRYFDNLGFILVLIIYYCCFKYESQQKYMPWVFISFPFFWYEFSSSIKKLVIDREFIKLHEVVSSKKILFSDIELIEYKIDRKNGNIVPQIYIFQKNKKKPIKLTNLYIETGKLYFLLEKFKSQSASFS